MSWAGVRSEVPDPRRTSVLLDRDGLGRAPPTLHGHVFIMQADSGKCSHQVGKINITGKLTEVRIQCEIIPTPTFPTFYILEVEIKDLLMMSGFNWFISSIDLVFVAIYTIPTSIFSEKSF